MSREVDERVVSMKFDNDQFEKGVKQTTSTLDKLKQALNFKGAGKDINTLNGQFAKVNFNPMASGIQAVNAKLSLMQQISIAVVERMTNAIIDATGKFANMTLQIDGMRDGFQEYELQMNSIQTIMANTQKYGTTLEDVKQTLGELNEYADKTVYVFSDMTNAIGKFTTAGVSLEDSTAAIKGMSNFAATVSADNTALARAEYQVSQALASGKFNLMDWRSLENAGMGGAKMQDTLKQVARDFGINIDAMIAKAGSFRDSLSEKKADGVWLTSDVFLEAMKRFAEDPTMIDAATKVRTFSKLIDTLKESIGTGWADTWTTFIGDFEEATELFTNLKDFFNIFIEGAAKARNAVLKDWVDAGGRSYGIAALYNVLTSVIEGFKAFKAGFAEIFPPETGQTLANLTRKFFEITEMLKNSPERLNAIQMAGRNVGVVCKTILTILQSGIQLITPFINVGKIVLAGLINLVVVLGQKLIPAIQNGTKVILPFVAALAAIAGIVALAPILALTAAIAGFGAIVVIGSQKAADFISWLKELTAVKAVGKFIDDVAAKMKKGQNVITAVFDTLQKRWTQFQDAYKNGKITPKSIGNDFKKTLDSIANQLGPLKGIFNFVKDTVLAIWSILYKVGKGLVDFAMSLSPMERALLILSGLFTFAVMQIGKAAMNLSSITKVTFDAFGGVLGGIKGVLGEYKKVVRTEIFVKWAYVIGVIAGSLALLAQCNSSKVLAAAGAISIVLAVLIGGIAAIELINNKLAQNQNGWQTSIQMLVSIAAAVAGLGAGVVFLTGSIIAIVKTEADIKRWISAGIAATVMIAELGLAIVALSKFAGVINPMTSIAILSFAIAISAICSSFAKLTKALDSAKIPAMNKALEALQTVFAGLAVVMMLTGIFKNTKAAGIGLIAFCGSIYLVLISLEKIVQMIKSGNNYTAAVGILVGMLVALGGVYFAMNWLGARLNYGATVKAQEMAIMLLGFVGTCYLLLDLVKKLEQMDPSWNTVGKFAAFIGSIAVCVALLVGITHVAGSLKGVAGVITSFAVAVGGIALTIALFADWFGKINNLQVVGGIVMAAAIMGYLTFLLRTVIRSSVLAGPAFATIIAVTAFVSAATFCMILLSHLSIPEAIPGILCLGAAMAGLYAVLLAISKLSGFTVDIKGMIGMILPLVTIAGVIIAIARLGGDWENIAASFAGLSLTMLAVAGVLNIIKGISSTINIADIGKFGLACLGLTFIADPLIQVSKNGGDWPNVVASAVALGAAILAVGGALRLANGVPWSAAGAIVIGCVPLIEVAFALSLVSKYNWEEIRNKLLTMGLAIVALGVIMTVVGGLSNVTAYMIVGAGIIAASLAILAVGMAGFVVEAVAFAEAAERFAAAMSTLQNISLDNFMVQVEKLTNMPDISEKFNQLTTKFTVAIQAMEGPIKLAWSTLATNVQNHAQAAMYGMCLNSINSAIKGIDDGVNSLYSAAMAASEVSVAGYCAGIKDPPPGESKEFWEMGSISDNSAAQGIKDGAADLQSTAESVASGTVEKAKEAVNSAIAGAQPEMAARVCSIIDMVAAEAGVTAFNGGAYDFSQYLAGWNSSAQSANIKIPDTSAFDERIRQKYAKQYSSYGPGIGEEKFRKDLPNLRRKETKDIGGRLSWYDDRNYSATSLQKIKYWNDEKKAFTERMEMVTAAEAKEKNANAELAKALGKTQEMNKAATEATEDFTSAIGDMDDAAGKAGGGGGGLEQEANALENLVDTIEGQINIFEEFNAETDLTKEKLLANMKSQIDGVINWSTKLSELATKGVDQGLLQKLAEMGPQGWKYVNAFSTMTTEELQEANKLWDQSLRLPQSAANQIGISFNMAGQMATKGYVDGLDPNCGNEIARAMGQNSLESIMEALGEHSPSTKMRQVGVWGDEGYILGVKDKENDIMTLITTIGTNITEEFRKQVSIDKWTSIGTDAMLGFQKGIKDKEDDILKLVESIGKKATEKLKTKGMDEHSPSASWEKIGANGMIGLMNGFKGYEESTLNYVTGVGSKLTNAMSYVVSTANQILEDGIDPVITPTLNLSNLNGQAGLIDRMLGQHRIDAIVAAQTAAGAGGGTSNNATYNFTINSTAMDPRSLAREIEKVIIRR